MDHNYLVQCPIKRDKNNKETGCSALEYCNHEVSFCSYCGSTNIVNINLIEQERIEKELREAV